MHYPIISCFQNKNKLNNLSFLHLCYRATRRAELADYLIVLKYILGKLHVNKAPNIEEEWLTGDPHYHCLVPEMSLSIHTLLSCVLVLMINKADGSFLPGDWSSVGFEPLDASPTGSIRICCCCLETDGLFDLLFLVFEPVDWGSVEGVEGERGVEDLLVLLSWRSVGRWGLLGWVAADPPFMVISLSWSSSVWSLAKLTNTCRKRTHLVLQSNKSCFKT